MEFKNKKDLRRLQDNSLTYSIGRLVEHLLKLFIRIYWNSFIQGLILYLSYELSNIQKFIRSWPILILVESAYLKR